MNTYVVQSRPRRQRALSRYRTPGSSIKGTDHPRHVGGWLSGAVSRPLEYALVPFLTLRLQRRRKNKKP